jgi:hypothetical protein
MIAAVHPDDLATIGYPVDTLWKALEEAGDEIKAPKPHKATRYRLERSMIVRLRSLAQRSNLFHRVLKKMQLVCDVLLRE